MLRPFARASEPVVSPLVLQLEAPTAARAQTTATLHVSVRHTLGRSAPVVVRIPLQPGTNLADPVEGVRQVQGALYVRTHLDSDPLPRVLAIPVRFSLPGTVTWPGATARIDDEEFPAARAPARPLVIGAPPR